MCSYYVNEGRPSHSSRIYFPGPRCGPRLTEGAALNRHGSRLRAPPRRGAEENLAKVWGPDAKSGRCSMSSARADETAVLCREQRAVRAQGGRGLEDKAWGRGAGPGLGCSHRRGGGAPPAPERGLHPHHRQREAGCSPGLWGDRLGFVVHIKVIAGGTLHAEPCRPRQAGLR